MKRLALTAALLLTTAPAFANCTQWQLQPGSTIEFTSSQAGKSFTGGFGSFTGDINFDPANPAAATADVTIDLASAKTGSSERDNELLKKDWFDVASFPTARFVSTSVGTVEGGSFVMTGDLTLRGVTLPLTIPFTFSEVDGVARVTGTTTIDSTAHGIGQGAWANDKTITRLVPVTLSLTAKRGGC